MAQPSVHAEPGYRKSDQHRNQNQHPSGISPNLPQPDKKLFSLSNLLLNLKELLHTDFQENQITFTLQCSPESISMEGDESQLSQVFLNLLKNAMQALEGNTHGQWPGHTTGNSRKSIYPFLYHQAGRNRNRT